MLVYALPSLAGQARAISPFISPALSRQIHGDERALDLSFGGHRFGRAQAFFGVDALSNADQQYLTSGLQWKMSAQRHPLLQLSALQTAARGGGFGAQTLVRAESQLNLGGRWYLPAIRSEVDQVSGNGSVGRAARVGLVDSLAGAHYSVAYFRADSHFNALGSAMVAGDSGLEFSGRYDLGRVLQISDRLGLHQPLGSSGGPQLVQRWVIERTPQATDVGSPWRLTAQFGNADAGEAGPMPIAIQVAAETARWRSWRLNSALGWYDGATATPDGLPVAGALWQVSASRRFHIGGFDTQWSPRFSLGGSRYQSCRVATRTGLSLDFPKLADNVNFSVDYLSPGWAPTASRGDVQVSLDYTHNAGALLPALVSAVGHFRLPWQRRH